MLKKVLISSLVSLSLAGSLSANSYDLKTNMHMLSATFSGVQSGLLSNDKKATLDAVNDFQKEIDALLGDKENITKLLPKKLKDKAPMATNTAKMIDKYLNEMRSVLNDDKMPPIERENKSQKAYINIQAQCFRCHNMVRDWE